MATDEHPLTARRGYSVAVILTALMFVVRYLLQDRLGDFSPLIPFVLSVIAAALYGGLWPGLFATVLGAVVATYSLVPPYDSFFDPRKGASVLVFLVIGGATSAVCEALHAMRRRVDADRSRVALSDAFYRAITNLTSDAAFSARLEEDGHIAVESVSDSFERMFGYCSDDVGAPGGPVAMLFQQDVARRDELVRRLRQGETVEADSRYITKEGRVRWLHFRVRAMRDQNANAVRLLGAATDVTEQLRTAAAMKESEARFRVMAEMMPSMIWMAAPDGNITYVNDQWQKFCSATPDGTGGRRWAELDAHPDDRERYAEKWQAALSSGTNFEIEVRHRRFDGEYRWFMTRAVPLKDDSGRIVSWFGVTTDIHEQKQMQEQLRDADRRKDQFLATLAHELRNPLAPMRNALQWLEMDETDPLVRQRARRIIERQLNQMVRLVDDLLDVSRITRGKLELRTERVELAAIIGDALETSRPLIEAASIELKMHLPPDGILLQADRTRLAQAFANLLNNAAKFTPHGGRIGIRAAREGSDVLITVRDSGVGIAPEQIERIFEMFAQGTPSPHSSATGLGIGLTIVKQLVEMHGGHVEARSRGPGQGSEFIVRLPAAGLVARTDRERKRPIATPVTPTPGRRILVVDDHEDAVQSLAALLRLGHHEVHIARDGVEAIEAATLLHPDAVLLDLGLPRMNGFEAAKRIRREEWGKNLLLIAITGWGQEEDKRRSRAAGFDYHLTKPVDPTLLRTLVEGPHAVRVIEAGQASEAQSA